jgi:superfamily I DNA and/or RNA helicase
MRRSQYYIDYDRPSSNSAEDLFVFCIKQVIERRLFSTSFMLIQWANKLFGYEKNSLLRKKYMSTVKSEYSMYFTRGLKYSFIETKIKRDFPSLFGISEEDDDGDYTSEDQVRDTIKALNKEIEEQQEPDNIESFRGTGLSLVRVQGKSYIYQVDLITNEGQEPNLHDDPFILRVYDKEIPCETVDFDFLTGRLFFSSNIFLKSAPYCRIILDSTFILEGLKKRLLEITEDGVNEDLPFAKFIFGETDQLANIEHKAVPDSYKELLDDSQRKAFDAAMDKDLTFIWGPPGTGKSFTLASIIYALYKLGEDRTAVCCQSNVAVDQLLCKVLDIIDKKERKIMPGKIYRAGRTTDSRVIKTDYLFPNDQKTKKIREQIERNTERLSVLKERKKDKSEEAILLKAENLGLRSELKDQTEFLINSSRLVFSTISNFFLNGILYNCPFDNLIVDEASMIAMPSLLALGHKITKRLIFVGDFQQLSPIAMARDHFLTESVFEMSGIDIKHTNHPALHQLLQQRRSNVKIVDLINNAFYASKLIPSAKEDYDVIDSEPFSGKVIALKGVKGAAVRFTKGGTRQNVKFAESVMKLLDDFSVDEDKNFTIGVITPYRGQASLLRALQHDRKYSPTFEKRLKIGTIHTFQGSECDVIIYDMVDCPVSENGRNLKIGKIYENESGERLLNVAVSRARHKLIIVCNPSYIENIPSDNVSHNTRALFKKLSRYKGVNEVQNKSEEKQLLFERAPFYFIKASKFFLSSRVRVVLAKSGFYLEVGPRYYKLGGFPKGTSSSSSNVWIKKAKDNRGLRIVCEYNEKEFVIGYIRENDMIFFTNPSGIEFKIPIAVSLKEK